MKNTSLILLEVTKKSLVSSVVPVAMFFDFLKWPWNLYFANTEFSGCHHANVVLSAVSGDLMEETDVSGTIFVAAKASDHTREKHCGLK